MESDESLNSHCDDWNCSNRLEQFDQWSSKLCWVIQFTFIIEINNFKFYIAISYDYNHMKFEQSKLEHFELWFKSKWVSFD